MAEITREIMQDLLVPERLVGRVQSRQVDGGESFAVGPGEVFFEPAEVRIDRFDGGDAELVFLAWFPVPAGVDPELRLV